MQISFGLINLMGTESALEAPFVHLPGLFRQYHVEYTNYVHMRGLYIVTVPDYSYTTRLEFE